MIYDCTFTVPSSHMLIRILLLKDENFNPTYHTDYIYQIESRN